MILSINNSYSKLTGLLKSEFIELRKLLSYSTGSYFSGFGVRKAYLINSKGEFPTGLSVIVRKWLQTKYKEVINNYIVDKRIRPTTKKAFHIDIPKNITLYREQVEAVQHCIMCDRGIISAPTGFGKSLTMGLLVEAFSLRTLIVVPNLELKRQLSEDFTNYFGSLERITIENIDSPKLKKCKDYDMLIVDEAHHSAAKTYRSLNKTAWSGIYHRFFFTATPFRSNSEEQLLMQSLTGELIYEVSYKTARDKGYIVPVEAYYLEPPTVPIQSNDWHSVYAKLVKNNDQRNQLLKKTLLALNEAGAPTLCLVKEVAHGAILSDLTGYPFASGENENTSDLIKQFNERKFNVLIGTEGVLGEGVDTKPCEYVVIAGLGKAKGQLMQKVGRGLRWYPGKTSCKVILIKDKSHKFTLNHFNEQCKVIKQEYGVKPVKI